MASLGAANQQTPSLLPLCFHSQPVETASIASYVLVPSRSTLETVANPLDWPSPYAASPFAPLLHQMATISRTPSVTPDGEWMGTVPLVRASASIPSLQPRIRAPAPPQPVASTSGAAPARGLRINPIPSTSAARLVASAPVLPTSATVIDLTSSSPPTINRRLAAPPARMGGLVLPGPSSSESGATRAGPSRRSRVSTATPETIELSSDSDDSDLELVDVDGPVAGSSRGRTGAHASTTTLRQSVAFSG